MPRPYLWQMIKAAVDHYGGKATYTQIRDYVLRTYGEVNQNSLSAQIIVCTVNQPSRVHYPENQKSRVANAQYDFLYSTGRGQVEWYDPAKHGVWEIRKDEHGKLSIGQQDDRQSTEFSVTASSVTMPPNIAAADQHGPDAELTETLLFPLESQLRDFIARNIGTITINNQRLQLYVDDTGRDGVEYRTDVGPIDILAVDDHNNFVVFELKLSRGGDAALGQILRYMGWIKAHLAHGRSVNGVIVAKSIDAKLRYAATIPGNITLFEYDIQFTLQQVQIQQ